MIYLATYVALIVSQLGGSRIVYFVALTAMFIFSAFRFEVGCDWTGYINEFNTFGATDLLELVTQREPLWKALIWLLNWLDISYPWLNVLSSAIFFAGVHVLARRQPDPLSFLILLFPVLIINMPMSGIRQASAIGVICFAYVAFIDRRLILFVALTLLATTLHSSAIVFLLLTPLVRGEASKTRLALSAMLAIPGTIALLSTGGAEIATSRYVDTSIDAAGAAFRVALLAITAIFFFVALKRQWATTFPQDYKLVMLGSIGMLVMMAIVPVSSVIGDRLGYYLVPIQTMIFARLPSFPLRGNRNLIIAAPYFGLLVVLSVWITWSALFNQCYVPYQTWLLGFPSARYAF